MSVDSKVTIAMNKIEVDALRAENDSLRLENEKLKEQLEYITDGISDQEQICLEQLRLLKKESDTRSLTLEETRKAEVLYKILVNIKDSRNDSSDNSDIKTEELLKLVDGESE
jgi:regulator of replication initiation timing